MANQEIARVGGVPLTNPDKVLYPEQGLTKRALAEYYARVADRLLPHVIDRPLSVIRCPRGRDKHCFFQRHPDEGAPAGVGSVTLADGSGSSEYIVISDLAGLLGLVQMGVLELHPWGARADKPELADRLVMDLDPGHGATFPDVIEAARWLHQRLATVGLASYVRTTGGKGLHVVAPLAPAVDWEVLKRFARGLAQELADSDSRYIAEASKAKRIGKVFVDYLRNARGASAIASYSTRARPGAPVATPLLWDELSQLESAAEFRVDNLPERLEGFAQDPWEGFFELRQTIGAQALASVKALD